MKSIRKVGALAEHTYRVVSFVVVVMLHIPVLIVHNVRNSVIVHGVRFRTNCPIARHNRLSGCEALARDSSLNPSSRPKRLLMVS